VRQLVSLHDTQFVLAREQGFARWPKLKAYAEPSSRSRHTRLFIADLPGSWRGFMVCCERDIRLPRGARTIRERHPRFSEKSDEEIRQAPFAKEDVRLVYAREHGFETWDDLTSRVNLLASTPAKANTEPFTARSGCAVFSCIRNTKARYAGFCRARF
jgi:hypothetical protein